MSSSREHVANEGADAQDRARQSGGESSSDETEVQITQRPARRDRYGNLYVPLNQRRDVPVPILWWLDPEMKFNWVQGSLLSFDQRRIRKMRHVWLVGRFDDPEVISFLLYTEIIPMCLRSMEIGSELSKTVATFIVQKILLDAVGLEYMCNTVERFFALCRVLGNMLASLAEQQSLRLLKHIIRCYLRISESQRGCIGLRSCFPDMLKDATFGACLRDVQMTRRWLQQLLVNVGVSRVTGLQAGAGFDHMMMNK